MKSFGLPLNDPRRLWLDQDYFSHWSELAGYNKDQRIADAMANITRRWLLHFYFVLTKPKLYNLGNICRIRQNVRHLRNLKCFNISCLFSEDTNKSLEVLQQLTKIGGI